MIYQKHSHSSKNTELDNLHVSMVVMVTRTE